MIKRKGLLGIKFLALFSGDDFATLASQITVNKNEIFRENLKKEKE